MKRSLNSKSTNFNWYGKTILIVENEDSNFKIIETLLSKSKVKILTTTSGENAVEICTENKDINLVLMDIRLPKMSGIEATKKIKAVNKNIRIIVQTAMRMNSEKIQSKCKCDDYLTKPIQPLALLNKLNKYLLFNAN